MKTRLIMLAALTAILALLLPTRSAASPDPSLLGFNWWVHVCQKPDTSDKCKDHRKLMPNARFGVHRDDNNDYWLKLRLPRPDSAAEKPLMELSIPIDEIELKDPENEPPKAQFSFHDFDDNGQVVERTMTVTLLRRAGQSTTTESCKKALRDRLGQGTDDDDLDKQCSPDNGSVVHWHIRQGPMTISDGEDPPDMNALGPPGDGQGSGSDTPPD